MPMAEHLLGPATPGPPATDAPAARRLVRRRWADPRLAIGALLVLASVVAGATVMNARDDRAAVWALASDVRSGQQPTPDDLRQVEVHLDGATADRYVEVTDPATLERRLAASVWAHDVRAGELLADSALGDRDAAGTGQLPLSVARGSMPIDLGAGDRVDVWVSPESARNDSAGAERMLESARVLSVQDTSSALGDSAARTVLLALDEQTATDLRGVLQRLDLGTVRLVRIVGPESS